MTRVLHIIAYTAQKKKFSINDFLSKRDQIRKKLRIWSHLLKKSLMENFIFLYSDISTFSYSHALKKRNKLLLIG